MKVLVCGYLFLFVIIAFGQTTEETPPTNSLSSLTGLSISGHAYLVSAIGDVHKSFMVKYGISKSTQIELQGFYDTYLLTESFRANLVSKVYLNDKFYLFSGMELEPETASYINVPGPYCLVFIAGTGYDISENFMIEVKSNVELNNSRIGVFGESLIEMPAV